MEDLVVAIGLVLTLEGILYAAAPNAMKRAMATLLSQPENAIRVSGLAAAALGVVIVWLARM